MGWGRGTIANCEFKRAGKIQLGTKNLALGTKDGCVKTGGLQF
jgi:hypothetical protein